MGMAVDTEVKLVNDIGGYGLFANESLEAGALVGIYCGDEIVEVYADPTEKERGHWNHSEPQSEENDYSVQFEESKREASDAVVSLGTTSSTGSDVHRSP